MTTESKPAKKRGFAAVKERLELENQELRRQLEEAQKSAVVTGAGLTPKIDSAYDIESDPLAWIDDDVYEVKLVADVWGFHARRYLDDQRGKQMGTRQTARRARRWRSCPFDFSQPHSPAEDANQKALKREWWCHTVTREFAEETFSGFDGIPGRVIVAVEDYKGISPTGRVMGKRTKSSDDPLREFIRRILQENPGGNARFAGFDTDARMYQEAGHIDPQRPNPYGTSGPLPIGFDTERKLEA